MAKVRAVIQARMGSSRLRGKSLMPVAGVPLLYYVIKLAQSLKFVDEVLVATSCLVEDEPIAVVAQAKGVLSFRGSSTDLLDRFVRSSLDMVDDDIIVRLTADNPFNFHEVSHKAFGLHLAVGADYTHVDGLSHTVCEIISLGALRWVNAQPNLDNYDREHVTPYLRRNTSQFKVNILPSDFEGIRRDLDNLLTVDTWQDLLRVERLLGALPPHHPSFHMDDVYTSLGGLLVQASVLGAKYE